MISIIKVKISLVELILNLLGLRSLKHYTVEPIRLDLKVLKVKDIQIPFLIGVLSQKTF